MRAGTQCLRLGTGIGGHGEASRKENLLGTAAVDRQRHVQRRSAWDIVHGVRTRAAERVDALIGIADDEKISVLARKMLDPSSLDRVHILILVDTQMLHPPPFQPRHPRWAVDR